MTASTGERFIVGIDDTDAEGAGSTGAVARALAEEIEAGGLGVVLGVTRHELLRDAKISATDGNAAFAVLLESEQPLNDVEDHAARFVRQAAERGSDPGVAVFSRHSDLPHVLAFGRRCQQEVMSLDDADRFASESNVRLRSLGDRRAGAVGALAAAGLRAGGEDGRYTALRGIRELDGRVTAGEIRNRTDIAKVLDEESGEELDRDDVVETFGWVRPRVVAGAPVLLTRRSSEERGLWFPLDRRPAGG